MQWTLTGCNIAGLLILSTTLRLQPPCWPDQPNKDRLVEVLEMARKGAEKLSPQGRHVDSRSNKELKWMTLSMGARIVESIIKRFAVGTGMNTTI